MPNSESLVLPKTPSSRIQRKGPSNLSPIPSITSATSIWTQASNEYLLQSTPKCFTLDDLEQSLSSIDLESLVFFPEKNIDLELRLPSMTETSRYFSMFIEDLPPRPDTSMSRASVITEKCRTVMQQIRKGMHNAKTSSQAICGRKEAQYDSDSETEGTMDDALNASNAILAQSPSTPRDANLQIAEASSMYSNDSPCPTRSSHKRKAIYGYEDTSPIFPLTMSTPSESRPARVRATYHPALSDASRTSPCGAYKQRRKSAFAILG